jgi:hypothetical protein
VTVAASTNQAAAVTHISVRLLSNDQDAIMIWDLDLWPAGRATVRWPPGQTWA